MSAERSTPKGIAAAEPVLDLTEVRRCIALLEAIAADRALLAEVPLEMRQALLIAAGHVSRPQSYQEKHLVKAMRRGKRRRDEAEDRATRASTGIRVARSAPVFTAPSLAGPTRGPEAPVREFKKPKSCYVCKDDFTRLHIFYDALCPECAELNYAKRFQTASLAGRVGPRHGRPGQDRVPDGAHDAPRRGAR